MPHLHLPAGHDEHDRAIAVAIARVLGSEELYVSWRADAGAARPVIPALCEDPRRRRRRGLGRLFKRAA